MIQVTREETGSDLRYVGEYDLITVGRILYGGDDVSATVIFQEMKLFYHLSHDILFFFGEPQIVEIEG
jgi:hypothetical protein